MTKKEQAIRMRKQINVLTERGLEIEYKINDILDKEQLLFNEKTMLRRIRDSIWNEKHELENRLNTL